MKKTNKKNIKPDYIVSIDDTINTPNDVYCAFARAKAYAGMKLTDDDLIHFVRLGYYEALKDIDTELDKLTNTTVKIEDDELVKDIIDLITKKTEKKITWYKKVWNWAKSLFKK